MYKSRIRITSHRTAFHNVIGWETLLCQSVHGMKKNHTFV